MVGHWVSFLLGGVVGCPIGVAILPLGSFLVTGLPSAPAPGQLNSELERVNQLIEELEYVKALKILNVAWQDPNNNLKSTAQILWWRGYVQAILGDESQAKMDFRQLLAVSPTFDPLAEMSPKIRTPYQWARDFWRDKSPPVLRVEAPRTVGVDGSAVWRVRLEHQLADWVTKVRLLYRLPGGEPARLEQPLVGSSAILSLNCRGVVAVQGEAIEIEFLVQATNRHGGVLLEHGRREEPLVATMSPAVGAVVSSISASPAGEALPLLQTVPPVPAEPDRFWSQWWFWAGSGTIVTVATVVTVLLVVDNDHGRLRSRVPVVIQDPP